MIVNLLWYIPKIVFTKFKLNFFFSCITVIAFKACIIAEKHGFHLASIQLNLLNEKISLLDQSFRGSTEFYRFFNKKFIRNGESWLYRMEHNPMFNYLTYKQHQEFLNTKQNFSLFKSCMRQKNALFINKFYASRMHLLDMRDAVYQQPNDALQRAQLFLIISISVLFAISKYS